MGAESGNAPIWSGESGFQESYLLLLSAPAQQAVLLVGQTLVAPVEGEAYGGLWAVGHDGQHASRRLAVASAFPIDQVRIDKDPVSFQVERGALSSRAWKGRVESREHRMGWSLTWASESEPFHYLPMRSMYRTSGKGSRILSPHPDLKVSGEILLGKRRVELVEASAVLVHRWGVDPPLSGHWALVPSFPDDPGVRFQAWVESGVPLGPWAPPFSVFRLTLEDRVLETRGLWSRIGERGAHDLDGWNFEGMAGDRRVVGQIEVPFNSRIGMTHMDAEGEWVYHYVCVSATLTLSIQRRTFGGWTTERELFADRCATFMVQTRDPDDDTPVLASLADPAS